MTPDVVDLVGVVLPTYGIERATVILDVDPLVNVRAVAVDKGQLAGGGVRNELWNQLFRVLAQPEVFQDIRNKLR